MKKYTSILSAFMIGVLLSFATSCSDDDENPFNGDVVNPGSDVSEGEGPSSSDVLSIPTGTAFLGDSIQKTLRYSLAQNPIKKVTASTSQNGHIAVLGGYKNESAVYVYAKTDDDGAKLSKEEITALLDKYYDVAVSVNGTEINASVTEKANIAHGPDFRQLRVSMKIFTPGGVSSSLKIASGSIFAENLKGTEHVATSASGAIKYKNSTAKVFYVTSTAGHIGFINSSATESMSAILSKGSVQFAMNPATKAKLNLRSTTNVSAPVLNSQNFKGTNNRTLVDGDLNGGGYSINASVDKGSVVFKWFTDNDN